MVGTLGAVGRESGMEQVNIKLGWYYETCARLGYFVFFIRWMRVYLASCASAAGSLLVGFSGWFHDVLCAFEVVGDGS